ncbi:hypothetical protein ACFPER_09515 [Agromyces aurantiacus]|uniref:Uncharacterized protein n=1 Tax=Agromyces aurantiacus TaxID=165814 RepID=A0ABV9R6E1_9MICO|nr:hypothetical protein [Agromyces aurantiacus]MBM7503711.1 hypothetical protein [Agromyces aurantiacus]
MPRLHAEPGRSMCVTAVCTDRERFGTVIGAVAEPARGIRIIEDLTVEESATEFGSTPPDQPFPPRGLASPAGLAIGGCTGRPPRARIG